MRVLVTGASGQFGQQFMTIARGHEVTAAYHVAPPEGWKGASVSMDLTSDASFAQIVADARPDWVVHAAAMTNVDACEKEPALAAQINGSATGALARAATQAGARFLYISTDYVFDGTSGPYNEADATGPVQEYGRSKLEGERQALAADADAVVARTAIVYGPHKKNFVTWLVAELDAGRPVRIVDDQWVTPTHTRDLVEQVLALIDADARGVFHTAGAEGCSRLEMAQQVAATFRLPASLIAPIKSSALQWTARRPMDSRLATAKMAKLKTPLRLAESLQILKGELER